jgi:hypothetical protein
MMKRLLLCALLAISPIGAMSVEDFLASARIQDAEQYARLSVLCRMMEELSVEDRTIIYVFLDSINDERDQADNDSDLCYECAALKKSE